MRCIIWEWIGPCTWQERLVDPSVTREAVKAVVRSCRRCQSIDPVQAVCSYNVSPKRGEEQDTVPQISVHPYEWRLPWQEADNIDESEEQTKVNSHNDIEVGGMPRHILDVRPVYDVPREGEEELLEISMGEGDSGVIEETAGSEQIDSRRQYPVRQRRPPAWLAGYERD